MKRVLAIAILLLLPPLASAQLDKRANVRPEDVTVCDLAKNPAAYSGKRIRVRAIYRYAFESQELESPSCCPVTPAPIWLVVDILLDDSSEKLYRKFPEGAGLVLATFTGTFETGNAYGTFADKSQLTANHIERIEHAARSASKDDDPTWVAKNCSVSPGAQPGNFSSRPIATPPWKIGDFTRSPSEHIINQIAEPFVVRSAEGVINLENGGSEEPLADVLFEMEGPGAEKTIRHAATDQQGRFKIGRVPVGTYKFKATLGGFQSVMGTVTVTHDAPKSEKIKIAMRVGV